MMTESHNTKITKANETIRSLVGQAKADQGKWQEVRRFRQEMMKDSSLSTVPNGLILVLLAFAESLVEAGSAAAEAGP